MSTGIMSFANKDRSLFYEFVESAKEGYDDWLNSGSRYKYRAKLYKAYGEKDERDIIQTDVKYDTPLFDNTVNVIDVRCPSLRDIRRNVEGRLPSSGASTYILFCSVLSGGHTPKLMEALANSYNIRIDLSTLYGTESARGASIKDIESIEVFEDAFLIGLDRNNDLDLMAFRFSKYDYKHLAINAKGQKIGVSSFHLDIPGYTSGDIMKCIKKLS